MYAIVCKEESAIEAIDDSLTTPVASIGLGGLIYVKGSLSKSILYMCLETTPQPLVYHWDGQNGEHVLYATKEEGAHMPDVPTR